MSRRAELAASAAAAAGVLAVLLGGGFYPLPRMVVGVGLVVVWTIASAGVQTRPDRVEWLLAGTMVWGALSAIWVGSSPLAAKEAIAVWITAGLLFSICRRAGEMDRRRALSVLLAGAAVVAAAVLVEAAGAGLRVGGLLENPNVTAALLVPILPVGWRFLHRLPAWRWGWTALVAAGVVGTGSRAGLLAAVVAIGVMLPRGRLRLTGLVTGSALAGGVLAWRFISQPDVLAWHRISIWQAVLKIWWQRPLTGVGPGGLVEAAAAERILHPDEIGRYQFVIGYAESTPLAILVQLGLVGLGLAGFTLAFWLWSSRRGRTNDSSVGVAGLAATATMALFHDLLTIDPVLWWWAVLAGLVGGASKETVERSGESLAIGVRWTLGIIIVWFTAWGLISPAYARWTWQRGEPTADHVARTLRVEPWLAEAPAERVRDLLGEAETWSWTEAAEALAWAETALEIQPGLARRWADLGKVHLRIVTDLGGTLHDLSRARRALDRACALDPRLPWHWLERARLASLRGDSDEAVELTELALANEPNTIRGWVFLGRLEIGRGRLDAARRALEEAERCLTLVGQPGQSHYDRELLMVPAEQLQRLRSTLEGPIGSHGESARSAP